MAVDVVHAIAEVCDGRARLVNGGEQGMVMADDASVPLSEEDGPILLDDRGRSKEVDW